MKALGGLLFGVAALGASLLVAPPALADEDDVDGIAACNNIDVSAEAQCEVQVEGGCDVKCTPVSVQAACAANLYVGCNGTCKLEAEASCEASCNVTDCVAKCNVNPGEFRCSADCEASCSGSCDAECNAMAGDGEAKARCQASCSATCQGKCDASCTGTAPEASCQARCDASCKGSCSGKANIKCQAACQAKGSVECEARVTGGCKARCETPEGAIFCSGEYVDAGDNLKECINALYAKYAIKVNVSGSSSLSSQCSNGVCSFEAEAEGEVSASCSVADPGRCAPAGSSRLDWVAGGLGLGLLLSLRRRAQARTSTK